MATRNYRISDEALEALWRVVDPAILDSKLDLGLRQQLARSKAEILDGEIYEASKVDPNGIKYLEFHEIMVGREYIFRDEPTLKPYLRGKRVKVTKKGRTNVTSKLLEPAGKYPAGTILSGPPSNLKEVI